MELPEKVQNFSIIIISVEMERNGFCMRSLKTPGVDHVAYKKRLTYRGLFLCQMSLSLNYYYYYFANPECEGCSLIPTCSRVYPIYNGFFPSIQLTYLPAGRPSLPPPLPLIEPERCVCQIRMKINLQSM